MGYTAYKKQIASLETSDADSIAKGIVTSAMDGTLNVEETLRVLEGEDLGTWTELMKRIATQYQKFEAIGVKPGQAVTDWLDALKNSNESLRILLAAVEENECVVEELDTIPMPDPGIIPDEKNAASVREWLDSYVQWVLHWHPFVHPLYAEASGIFVLSAIAARRIVVDDMGEPIYTSLYIMLFAETSVGKSTCAKMAQRLLRAVGIAQDLIVSGKVTPQKFIQDSTGQIPRGTDFEDMTPSAEEAMMRRIRYAGKRAVISDEFGQLMGNMYSQNGTYKQFLQMMLSWYGSDVPDGYDSISNGSNMVENPYMPVLGCGTFKNVRDVLKFDPYGDGFIPRWAALGLPKQPYIPHKRVSGTINVPSDVIIPIRKFLDMLGEPQIHIQEEKTKKGNSTYHSVVDHYPEHSVHVTGSARGAIDMYDDFLLRCAGMQLVHEELEGCYKRMGDRAIRIAALIAFLENGGEIDTRVWAAAVNISERWRKATHVFHSEVAGSVFSADKNIEDKIIRFLEKQRDADVPVWQTVAIIANRTRTDIAKVQRVLESLLSAGVLETPVESAKRKGVLLYALEGTPIPIVKKQGRPRKEKVEVEIAPE